ncbi:MAG: hypothetical protein ACKO47_06275 [Alphaproteobacteria bacterium]
MKKDLIIKIGIGIVSVIFGYCVFWFFKAGQIEKQLNKFITDNSANIAVAELSVSGFPISQKITVTDLKLTIPTALFNKKQIIVKNIEAKASIFSDDFVVTSIAQVSVNDIEKGMMPVEFSKDPEISFTVSSSGVQKINYQDMGYRITDNEKNIFYSASRTSINIQTSVDELQKTIVKIVGNINEVQGFGVIDVYKSGLEKKIIEGIKTEEIVFGSAPPSSDVNVDVKSDHKNDAKKLAEKVTDAGIKQQDLPNAKDSAKGPANQANASAPAPATAGNPANVAPTAGVATANNTNPVPAGVPAGAPPAVPAPNPANNPPAVANKDNPAPTTDPNQLSPAVSASQVPSAITDSNIVKSNITIDVEYHISSNEQPQVPSDPSQVKEMAIQSSKVVKINNIEFSNPLYKLLINGQLTILSDDNLPSGGVSFKVENVDNLVNQLVTQLGQMTEQPKVINENRPNAEASVVDTSVQDAYKNFLKRIAINLPSVSREISSKNPVTKENIAQFDIRREKNLDFIVNEISIHEILGKF